MTPRTMKSVPFIPLTFRMTDATLAEVQHLEVIDNRR